MNTLFSTLRSALNDALTPADVVALAESALSDLDNAVLDLARLVREIAEAVSAHAAEEDRDGRFSLDVEETFLNELKDQVEEWTFTLGK